MKIIKDFDSFVNENLNTEGKLLFDINLMEVQEFLDINKDFWKEAKQSELGQDEEWDDENSKIKNNITAILKVYSLSTQEENEIDSVESMLEYDNYNSRSSYEYDNYDKVEKGEVDNYIHAIVDETYFKNKYKVKIEHKYIERTHGSLGSHGGEVNWTVYCGLDQLTKKAALDLFFEMMVDTNYFNI